MKLLLKKIEMEVGENRNVTDYIMCVNLKHNI